MFVSNAVNRPEVDICSLDGVEQQLGHSHPLHVDEMRLEKGFRSPEPLPTHLHLSAIRELQNRDEKVKKYLTLETFFFKCTYVLQHNNEQRHILCS